MNKTKTVFTNKNSIKKTSFEKKNVRKEKKSIENSEKTQKRIVMQIIMMK